MPDTAAHQTEATRFLGEARVTALAATVMGTVRDHLGTPTPHPDKVLEALNAMAVTVGVLLAGTGNDSRAREFFDMALNNQVRGMGQ